MWQRHKAERGVWSRGMLEALERGVKGGKWFSLIDKVYSEKTLAVGWEKVKSNAGDLRLDDVFRQHLSLWQSANRYCHFSVKIRHLTRMALT